MGGTMRSAWDGGEGKGGDVRMWTRRALIRAGALSLLGWWGVASTGDARTRYAGPRIRVVPLRRASLYATHDRAG